MKNKSQTSIRLRPANTRTATHDIVATDTIVVVVVIVADFSDVWSCTRNYYCYYY
jgi:hypothetical protein